MTAGLVSTLDPYGATAVKNNEQYEGRPLPE